MNSVYADTSPGRTCCSSCLQCSILVILWHWGWVGLIRKSWSKSTWSAQSGHGPHSLEVRIHVQVIWTSCMLRGWDCAFWWGYQISNHKRLEQRQKSSSRMAKKIKGDDSETKTKKSTKKKKKKKVVKERRRRGRTHCTHQEEQTKKQRSDRLSFCLMLLLCGSSEPGFGLVWWP